MTTKRTNVSKYAKQCKESGDPFALTSQPTKGTTKQDKPEEYPHPENDKAWHKSVPMWERRRLYEKWTGGEKGTDQPAQPEQPQGGLTPCEQFLQNELLIAVREAGNIRNSQKRAIERIFQERDQARAQVAELLAAAKTAARYFTQLPPDEPTAAEVALTKAIAAAEKGGQS